MRLFASTTIRTFSTSLRDVVIVSGARTPIGSFNGALASFTAPQLGAAAIRAAVERAGIVGTDVQEVYMGNVVSAGLGQAPARQAVIFAGLPAQTSVTTINKVCSSGMKSLMLGAQQIRTGEVDCMVVGGMESMSNIPYLLPKVRTGLRYGHGELLDGILQDGLNDAFEKVAMGVFAERTAAKHKLTREQTDEFAKMSYTRALDAQKNGRFSAEIVPVAVPQKKGDPKLVSEDEEPKKVDMARIPSLPTVFQKNGTVTAANASSLNDGGAALVIMSAEKAKRAGIKPLARIRAFADAEHAPEDFPTAPSLAVPRALKLAGMTSKDVHYWEINEAFSTVILANAQLLQLDLSNVNVNGGAVALGHPIGMSGARIIITLLNVLSQRNATVGCAAICNGGGGASSVVIERLN